MDLLVPQAHMWDLIGNAKIFCTEQNMESHYLRISNAHGNPIELPPSEVCVMQVIWQVSLWLLFC